jgi:hypothetical protein
MFLNLFNIAAVEFITSICRHLRFAVSLCQSENCGLSEAGADTLDAFGPTVGTSPYGEALCPARSLTKHIASE